MQEISAIKHTLNSIRIMSIEGFADLMENAISDEWVDNATGDLSYAQLANGEHVLIVHGQAANFVVIPLVNQECRSGSSPAG